MMLALKAQMHEDRTLPPGPPACIEVEDSPVEVQTPQPKTSKPPDTPDDLSREKVRNPLARQLSFSDIRQRLKCWQFMKPPASKPSSGPPVPPEVLPFSDLVPPPAPYPEVPPASGFGTLPAAPPQRLLQQTSKAPPPFLPPTTKAPPGLPGVPFTPGPVESGLFPTAPLPPGARIPAAPAAAAASTPK